MAKNRSIYGAANPQYGAADGAGATKGFSGGRGKPGYPVPDEMFETDSSDHAPLNIEFDPHVVQRLIDAFKDKLETKGLKIGRLLGSGMYGMVYDAGGGKVLKLTTDKADARTSNHLSGKKNKHLVNVFDVFKFPKTEFMKEDYFGIVEEKLQPLDKNNVQALSSLDDVSLVHSIVSTSKTWDEMKKKLLDKDKTLNKEETEDLKKALVILDKTQFPVVIEDLVKNSVIYYDFHVNNFMKRGDDLVLIDMGWGSRSPGVEPKTLESVVIETIEEAFSSDYPEIETGEDAKSFVMRFVQVLEKRGLQIDADHIIGAGAQGYIFDAGGGKVLKITPDATDADTCFKLIGKKFKHIVKIFDVFKFPKRDIYGIVQEKLQKLDKNEARIFTDNFNKSQLKFYNDIGDGTDWFTIRSDTEELHPDRKKHLDFLESMFKMDEIIDDVNKSGVGVLEDFHSSNMMKRGEDYVVIDFGFTKPEPSGGVERLREDFVGNENSVINAFADKLEKLGIVVGKKLGAGTYGTAYDIGDKKVLKITLDRTEALASHHLIDKNLDHVVKVYDVFKFPKTKWYGIIEEKLQELSQIEGTKFHRLTQMLKRAKAGEQILDGVIETVVKKVLLAYEYDSQKVEEFIDLVNEFDFAQMIQELADEHVQFIDYHEGNVGKRGDKYVVFDLGLSRSPGKEPRELESKKLSERINLDQVYSSIGSRELLAKKLAKRGIELKSEQEIGRGAKGFVLETKDGKVLKITEDDTEAIASMNVLKSGKDLKHVVKIYDVFAIPFRDHRVYAILQEKLSKMDAAEIMTFEKSFDFVLAAGVPWDTFSKLWKDVVSSLDDALSVLPGGNHVYEKMVESALKKLESFNVPEMMEELHSAGIEYHDFHSGNIMKRGSDYVIIDLGVSYSRNQEIPVLEQMIAEIVLSEAKADMVGVTIGRFQPFHKGHAEMIRNLARQFNKTIVLIAGNVKDAKNPLSFETRVELIQKSLPDIMNKIELHRATFQGKDSGYVPGILSDISENKKSSINFDTGVNVLVGEDRFADVKKQFERAVAKKDEEKLWFDPTLAVIGKLSGVKNDDEASRISGTQVREALLNGDKESVKKMVDAHLVSNEQDFNSLYDKMRDEMGARKTEETIIEMIVEDLKSVGGKTVLQRVLDANEDKLDSRGINTLPLRGEPIGQGEEGAIWDLHDGKVLKVTTGAEEANSSVRLIGKVMKHVVKIYDVFEFINREGAKERVFGIVMEKLDELKQSEKNELNLAITELRNHEELMVALERGDWDAFRQRLQTTFSSDQARVSQLMSTLQKYKIPEMMKELKDFGIKYSDYHGGNVMKRRGGDIVVTDLGGSMSAMSPIAKLESKIAEAVMNELSGLGGSLYGSPGTVTTRTGNSGWSTPMAKISTDPDDLEGLWQNQLQRMAHADPVLQPGDEKPPDKEKALPGIPGENELEETVIRVVEDVLGEANVTTLAQMNKVPIEIAKQANGASREHADALVKVFVDRQHQNLWKGMEDVSGWLNRFDEFMELIGEDLVSYLQKHTKPNQKQEIIDLAKKDWREFLHVVRKSAQQVEKDPVVVEMSDGWKWVKVESEKSKKREGERMQHCGQSQGDMYSLRDLNDDSHVTLDIENNEHYMAIVQMRGKNNKLPKIEYTRRIEDLVKELKKNGKEMWFDLASAFSPKDFEGLDIKKTFDDLTNAMPSVRVYSDDEYQYGAGR